MDRRQAGAGRNWPFSRPLSRCERSENEAAAAVESEDAPLKSGRVMRRARKRGLNFKRLFEVGQGKRKTFRFQKQGRHSF